MGLQNGHAFSMMTMMMMTMMMLLLMMMMMMMMMMLFSQKNIQGVCSGHTSCPKCVYERKGHH